jgi:hypothetical protein
MYLAVLLDLTTSGGPITTTGTITLAGTLNLANGGTGATTVVWCANKSSSRSGWHGYSDGNCIRIKMATNTFKSYPSKNVGTSAASVYTCPASTQTTIIGLSMANTTSSPITTDAYITRSAVNYYLIEGATVPVGSA